MPSGKYKRTKKITKTTTISLYARHTNILQEWDELGIEYNLSEMARVGFDFYFAFFTRYYLEMAKPKKNNPGPIFPDLDPKKFVKIDNKIRKILGEA